MKSELKEEIKNFLLELDIALRAEHFDTAYFEKWTTSLLEKVNKKRGRVKGTKYPRVGKEAQALGTKTFAEGFVDSPMFGRQLDVSMLTRS